MAECEHGMTIACTAEASYTDRNFGRFAELFHQQPFYSQVTDSFCLISLYGLLVLIDLLLLLGLFSVRFCRIPPFGLIAVRYDRAPLYGQIAVLFGCVPLYGQIEVLYVREPLFGQFGVLVDLVPLYGQIAVLIGLIPLYGQIVVLFGGAPLYGQLAVLFVGNPLYGMSRGIGHIYTARALLRAGTGGVPSAPRQALAFLFTSF